MMTAYRTAAMTFLFAATAFAADPATPELVHLDGKRVTLASAQKPVTVLLLWTSMCADPAAQLKTFDALAGHYAKDRRVGMMSVSIDQAKTPDDLAVIQEIVAPLKLRTPVVSDTGYRVLGFVEGKDYGGRPPSELRVPIVAVLRDGAVVHRGGLPSTAPEAEVVEHYRALVDTELAKLPKRKSVPRPKL